LIVGIIGFGYIGSVIGSEIASRKNSVLVYEESEIRRKRINAGYIDIEEPGLSESLQPMLQSGQIRMCDEMAELQKAEVILICVGTPLNEGIADLAELTKVADRLQLTLNESKLVIIKSTVPPGSTDDFSKILNRSGLQHHIAFSPERLAEGQAIEDFRSLPIIVGGIDKNSTIKAEFFWKKLGFEVIAVSDAKTAELIKLADNCWIDLNIAFAHELAQICDKIEVDVLEVIKSANTLKKGSSYVNILVPSVGVGGYCLTKDPIFLHTFAQSIGVDLVLSVAGRNINDKSPRYLVNRLLAEINELEKKKILIIGIAFKNNSGDIRFSPAIEFMYELDKLNISYKWFDALVRHDVLEEKILLSRIDDLNDSSWDVIVNLASHNNESTNDIVKISELLENTGFFVDGRRFLTRNEIATLNQHGIKYLGVGRNLREFNKS
jgi:UDP-N-acetyl-D-mannosaminuronic acid dehydrogenase